MHLCQKHLQKWYDTVPFLAGLFTILKMLGWIMRATMWAFSWPLTSLQTSLVMSVYLTISVSVERYISVVYPLLSIRLGIIMSSSMVIMTIIVRLHSQTSYLKMALPAIVFSIVFTLPTYFMLDNSCEKVNFSLAFRTWMRKTKNFPLWHLDNYISSWKLLRKMFRCSMVTTVTIMRTQWNSMRSLKR